VKPACSRMASTFPCSCCPCCSEQGDWNATRTPAWIAGMFSMDSTSERSFAMDEMCTALSRYCASFASRWPYSFTVEPQPLAVMTMASTSPRSASGHQASISARMSSRPASWSFRWKRSAPQQPLPAASINEMPIRSSTRAAAALMEGASAGCTQPASTSIFRRWRTGGQSPAFLFGRIFCCRDAGSSGRSRRPVFNKNENSRVLVKPNASTARFARSQAGRVVRSSTTARPMSARRPYCTPEGQVVSQARQVRQRSRCRRVLPVTGAPSSTRLIR